MEHTDDEGDHGGPISSGGLEAFDELLDLPNLDVLLRLVCLRGAHDEQRVKCTSLSAGS